MSQISVKHCMQRYDATMGSWAPTRGWQMKHISPMEQQLNAYYGRRKFTEEEKLRRVRYGVKVETPFPEVLSMATEDMCPARR